ncbi:DapH/DapD/GlmU-related protein [Enterococcus dongliensis]|uniref:DapH/DapD/GlmU-related protein n=1 Tax=Enterococcus dongliensis TaxID=2559925 RepID=A0AAW8TNI6_9ENTE|nr:DapH/DapD/GlmU-related protein [Enterococcus dongliensis]MDT2597322.1 DapH/DapD/GlmU-related protein [Enterococcus dongliensis]MDT2604399.1 DapH/DapD/GlmU-related protein [Enterococcus dongliensis]MDT2635191.1 DapH/DapD/GlmU-related protein [Enterococcus dongliensis]MDT2637805.1 DapH/DapD/GlmU-related protein [Enterococcus dongliensis]MDT2638523.1 DapH/DapD/GlmU-related protein [Enterococcus dongliensis]
MAKQELLEKIQGIEILPGSAIYDEIHLLKANNEQLLMKMNGEYHSPKEIRMYLEEITGKILDESVEVSQPFYTDFGKHTSFGKHIFINQNVTFVDLGGIEIEDHVLIGPMCRIITVNHLVDPKKRRGLSVAAVKIKENAWLGANVTILPGVTVGKNAIVAADATVTKDVPDNVIVAGSPATIIKEISY